MDEAVSPLAPKIVDGLPEIDGVRLGAVEAGIKYASRKDLCVMLFDKPATVAGVFTKSLCPSAAVDWCRRNLPGGIASCVVINSGNANAFTGKKGAAATLATAQMAAEAFNVSPDTVFLASTGVIGEPLDPTKFDGKLSLAAEHATSDQWAAAARAIMTTDTFPKLASRSFEVDGKRYLINGIAKGAGMIAPDMATMLSFIVTDCPLPQEEMQACLSAATQTTFNAITVDSDTSTSDTVLLFSVGNDDAKAQRPSEKGLQCFRDALQSLMLELAQMIVRDGEGATKFVEVQVNGATSDEAAKTIALAIANSPLVKTAINGEDANWGRVVMAVGKAGEQADRDRLSIFFGGIRVAHEGERDPAYDEDKVSAIMKRDEIVLGVDLGLGEGKARVWTCDLSKQYVEINGDYRS